jgi:hypothetical protein
MRYLQTIDLRDATDSDVSEQQRVLDQITAISGALSQHPWSDEHDLQSLLLRYEDTSWGFRAG